MLIGDVILMIGLLVWMTISIGPWWLGLSMFILTIVFNVVHQYVKIKILAKEHARIQNLRDSIHPRLPPKK